MVPGKMNPLYITQPAVILADLSGKISVCNVIYLTTRLRRPHDHFLDPDTFLHTKKSLRCSIPLVSSSLRNLLLTFKWERLEFDATLRTALRTLP